ncbi:MAG TPA: 2-hydroxyacid dehydrogenase [Vicinamibacterales bacterium]|nr:2-hydroxyacid dehydrogenase [Vicinamibacterales bacterium]
MKVLLFDTHSYERQSFTVANEHFGHALAFLEARLTRDTAGLAAGHEAVCAFVNDRLDAPALQVLREVGARLVALRSAGFNHVDLAAATALGLPVVRVPEYSPYAVAEHAVGLILALNRKIHRAYARVREWNFSLDGLVGFDLHGKAIGLIGTGKIGRAAVHIFHGLGCRILAHDTNPDATLAERLGVRYVELAELYRESHIISLHVPLTPSTHHMINDDALSCMRRGIMIINTGRGALIDSRALLAALKTGHVGAAGLDVYEEEEGVFFRDLSNKVLQDDVLARLLTFPNVLVTAHQAFLTREALANIASTTLANITAFESGEPLVNEVRAHEVLHHSSEGIR